MYNRLINYTLYTIIIKIVYRCITVNTYVINNCISSLHSGLTTKQFCMARDGGKLENLDYC